MFLETACWILGVVGLLAASCPVLALLAPGSSTAGRPAARRGVGAALLVCLVAAGAATGWTLRGHAANVVVVFAAFGAAACLALFVFTMRPRPLALALGAACVLAWPLAALLALLVFAFEGNAPAVAQFGNGMYCRVTSYGAAGGDSGEDIELFERFGLLDHRRAQIRQSAVYPGDDGSSAPGMAELAVLCRARAQRGEGASMTSNAAGMSAR